jgi:hypothetical protein
MINKYMPEVFRKRIFYFGSPFIFISILFMIAGVIDPVGHNFAIRWYAISSMCIYVFYQFSFRGYNLNISKYRNYTLILYICLLPLWGILVGLLRGNLNYDFNDTSYIAAGIILLYAFSLNSIEKVRIAMVIFLYSLRLIVIITLSSALLYISGNTAFNDYLILKSIAIVAERSYSDFGNSTLFIYLLACPILVYLVFYDAFNVFNKTTLKNIFLLVTSILAMLFSGTRAHITIAISVIPLTFIYYINKYIVSIKIKFLFVFLIIIFSFGLFSESFLQNWVSNDNELNYKRYDLLRYYLYLFNEPFDILFGQGFNAAYGNQEINLLTEGGSKTELTYLELIRVYGLLPATIIIYHLLYTARKLIRIDGFEWFGMGFFFMLINSMFNPYLFSVNGMLPLAISIGVIANATKRSLESHSVIDTKTS